MLIIMHLAPNILAEATPPRAKTSAACLACTGPLKRAGLNDGPAVEKVKDCPQIQQRVRLLLTGTIYSEKPVFGGLCESFILAKVLYYR